MEWTQLFTIALGAILVNNFIVAQFLGICPFMGVSQKDRDCLRHGAGGYLRHGPGLRHLLAHQ